MKRLLHILILTLFIGNQLFAQELPEKPNRLVNDNIGLLTKQEVNSLERKLVNYNDTTSTQIAILIVGDLQGYDIVDYAQRVGQKWGAGQKGKDNGVIIVLMPKTATSKGEVNIDVGYGMEPIIPDITAKRIVENEMIPHFKNDDYYGGLNAAIDVVIGLAAGQFSADDYNKRNSGGSGAGFLVPIIAMIIIFTMINRKRKGTYTAGSSGRSSLPLWTALWLASSMGRGHSGSWGNFNSGSGGFGSGGGGGFGGFGGGGFGGGGASGSW